MTDWKGSRPTSHRPPRRPHSGAHTMIILDSSTSGSMGGARVMVTLAVTAMVVPEGLMVQRGGLTACSFSFSGELITEGLWGQTEQGRQVTAPDCYLVSTGEGGKQGMARTDLCGITPRPSDLHPAPMS